MNEPFLLCFIGGLVLAFLSGCVGSNPGANGEVKDGPPPVVHKDPWYLGRPGIAIHDPRLPPSVPYRVRERYRVSEIHANPENSWMAWFTAFPVVGSTGGEVEVYSFGLEWLSVHDDELRPTNAVMQFYLPGDTVWGGWFPFDDRTWFGQGMIAQNDFPVERREFEGYTSPCAVVDVGKHLDRRAAGHIWMKRWPRDVAPRGTVRIRIRVVMRIRGDVLCNIGLDRYHTDRTKPEPDEEVLVSDTYGNEHGIVRLVIESGDIKWE